MTQMDDASKELVFSLLTDIKRLVVPQCVHAGEELAYTARRDQLLDRVVAVIQGGTEAVEMSTLSKETIHVNQQKLADSVIQKTFDQHKNLLRKKLADAEEEAEKWKNIALGRAAPEQISEVRQMCQTETQTDALEIAAPDKGVVTEKLSSKMDEWYSISLALYSSFSATIADIVAEEFWHLGRQYTDSKPKQCKLSLPSTQSILETDNASPTAKCASPSEKVQSDVEVETDLKSFTADKSARTRNNSNPGKKSTQKVTIASSGRAREQKAHGGQQRYSSPSARYILEPAVDSGAVVGASGDKLYAISSLRLSSRANEVSAHIPNAPNNDARSTLPALAASGRSGIPGKK